MQILRVLRVPAIVITLYLLLAGLITVAIRLEFGSPPNVGGDGLAVMVLGAWVTLGVELVVVGLVASLLRWVVVIRRRVESNEGRAPGVVGQALRAAAFGGLVAIGSCPFVMCCLFEVFTLN